MIQQAVFSFEIQLSVEAEAYEKLIVGFPFPTQQHSKELLPDILLQTTPARHHSSAETANEH
jgi:hypothetical protein